MGVYLYMCRNMCERTACMYCRCMCTTLLHVYIYIYAYLYMHVSVSVYVCIFIILQLCLNAHTPRVHAATPPGCRRWSRESGSGGPPSRRRPSTPARRASPPEGAAPAARPWTAMLATGSQTCHWSSPEPWNLSRNKGQRVNIRCVCP